jgi:hypothetical protein
MIQQVCSVVVIAFVLIVKVYSQDECTVSFITQPPSSVPCNPFNDEFNNLQLECNIITPVNSSIKISWYYQPNYNASAVKLKRNARYRIPKKINLYNGYQSIRSRITVIDVNNEDSGYYWCQATIYNEAINNKEIEVSPCQVTTLRKSDYYSDMPPCSDTYFTSPEFYCVYPEFVDHKCSFFLKNNETSSLVSSVAPATISSVAPTVTPSITNKISEQISANIYVSLIIPSLGLPLIIICSFFACFGVFYICKKRNRRNKKRTPSTAETATTHYIPTTTVTQLSPVVTLPIPNHLSVSRQPSSDSQYTQLPLKEDKIDVNIPTVPISLPQISDHASASKTPCHIPIYINTNALSKKQSKHPSNPIDAICKATKKTPCLMSSVNCTARPPVHVSIQNRIDCKNIDEEFYVNYCSSAQVYQALTPDTLEEQTLYTVPESSLKI